MPILYDSNTLILIDPEIEYLALSNDNEEFFSLHTKHWKTCISLNTHKICKENQIFYHRSRTNICELSLLMYPTIPDICKINMIILNTPIWDKLIGDNSWLFYSQPTTITIKYTEPSLIISTEISEIGRLTTSPNCEIHTENSIIFPTSKSERNVNNNLIPKNNNGEFLSKLLENLQNIIPQNLKDINIITAFNSLSKKLTEIDRFQIVTTHPFWIRSKRILYNYHIHFVCNIDIHSNCRRY